MHWQSQRRSEQPLAYWTDSLLLLVFLMAIGYSFSTQFHLTPNTKSAISPHVSQNVVTNLVCSVHGFRGLHFRLLASSGLVRPGARLTYVSRHPLASRVTGCARPLCYITPRTSSVISAKDNEHLSSFSSGMGSVVNSVVKETIPARTEVSQALDERA